MDDRPSGAVEVGVQGPGTQEGCTTATPPPHPFEEPSWSSWGQEEASKLHRNRRRTGRRDFIIAV